MIHFITAKKFRVCDDHAVAVGYRGRLSRNRNAAGNGRRFGYGISVLAHRFQMNLDRAPNEFGGVLEGCAGGDAAWKIRNIGTVTRAGFS